MKTGILFSTRKHPFKQVIALAKEFRADGVELVLHHESCFNEALALSIAERAFVKAIHAPNLDFTRAAFERALDSTIQLAKQLNVSVVNVHPPGLQFEHREKILGGIKLISRLSQRHPDLALCCEVLPFPYSDKHRRRQAYEHPRDWVADIKEFKLAATLDTTHVASWGEDPAIYVKLLGENLHHIHVSDFRPEPAEQHLLLGEGSVNIGALCGAVKALAPKHPLYFSLEQASHYDLDENRLGLTKSLKILQKGLEK